MKFHGAFTALVTPFLNESIDEEAYRALIEWQITSGIQGLAPCGTTGESATMTHDEHKQAISICVDQVKGRVPVIAGAGSNNTLEAIELSKFAKDAGADAALLITPYYNKPPQNSLIAHFKTVAKAVDIPIIGYNVPGRTCVNMLPETVATLYREVPNFVGLKDATGDMTYATETIALCGPEFSMLSGDDLTTLPFLSLGGHGAISVTSNILPDKVSALCKAFAFGNFDTAQKLHYELFEISKSMFWTTNPIPVKTALEFMGKIKSNLRLPLTNMSQDMSQKLYDFLQTKNIL